MKLHDLFANYIGLGNNCEFGIVADAASNGEGVANASLFHAVGFNNTGQIIECIRSNLDGMFDEGYYNFVKEPGWSDYCMECLKNGFNFHTGIPINAPNAKDEFAKKLRAMRYRKRLFQESLVTGDKIFVYRHDDWFGDEVARELFGALRRHGPARLLILRQDPEAPFGHVEAVGDGLYFGTIAHLSHENPPLIDFAAWEKVTRSVLAFEKGADPVGSVADIELPIGHDGSAVCTITHHTDRPVNAFSSVATPGEKYTFTADVYVPAGYDGIPISPSFMGWPSEDWTAANLDIRDQWQTISVTAVASSGHMMMIPCVKTSSNSSGPVHLTNWAVRRG
jgi:hypothetical protein